jgi:hypothetical protein
LGEAVKSFVAVRRILNADWDPIGLSGLKQFDPNTDDEYGGYARELSSMLAHGADPVRISEYLEWAERHMGIDVSPERIQAVTDKLLSNHND